MKRYNYKIPNGKLIRIKIELSNDKINYFKLSGDFFIYPEEKIIEIENSIIGKSRNEYSKSLNETITRNNIQLVGLKEEDITNIINNAFEDEV